MPTLNGVAHYLFCSRIESQALTNEKRKVEKKKQPDVQLSSNASYFVIAKRLINREKIRINER